MNSKRKTEVYAVSMLLVIGISLVVYFFLKGNYFDLAYGIVLIIYGIKLNYLSYKKSKGYLPR